MGSLPHLWQPLCPACHAAATERLALGDDRGPRLREAGDVTCARCGARVHVDRSLEWRPLGLE